ncbi:hypothetical protein KR026_006826, partial [Drosophila bipectinata]
MVTRRQDGKLNDVSQNVKKIRRTAKGDLLLELAAKDENALKIRQTLSQVLGEAASVRAVTGETTMEIHDLDDLTTKDEIVAAIKAFTNGHEEAIRVKSLRPGYFGTQVAFLGVESSLASKILSKGRIRIGWTMCRVRERTAQRRCFRTNRSLQTGEGFIRAKVGAFWLYSCYLPSRLTLQQFTHTLEKGHRFQVVIAGDFNAWAEEWGSLRTNARGRTLQETFATLDVALVSTGSQNTFGKAGYGSIVDLTFCCSGLFRRTRWSLSGDYT